MATRTWRKCDPSESEFLSPSTTLLETIDPVEKHFPWSCVGLSRQLALNVMIGSGQMRRAPSLSDQIASHPSVLASGSAAGSLMETYQYFFDSNLSVRMLWRRKQVNPATINWICSAAEWPFVFFFSKEKSQQRREQSGRCGNVCRMETCLLAPFNSIGRFIGGRCDDDGQASDVFPPVKYRPPVDAPLPQKKGTAKILIRPNCLVEWTRKSSAT